MRILILGAGNIGDALAELLRSQPEYEVAIADRDEAALRRMPEGVPRMVVDVSDEHALRAALEPVDAVVSACPYFLSLPIARAARDTHTHYFDLTEDLAMAHEVRALADGADTVFMPQCGLAPGFISIAAYELTKRFDTLKRVRMRVGALPLFPVNAVKYNLTWSTAGLVNEYCNPCEAIHEGEKREVLPLEGYEEFSLDGVTYETFNTSGGLGTLCETLMGRVEYLSYKTVRYPGHCELMRFLCQDLGLCDRRELFVDLLEHAVPATTQDVVLIFVSVSGTKQGRLMQETFTRKVYHGEINGRHMAGIQITTAASQCAILDLHREGKIPQRGFVRQEDVALSDFLQNRFGRYYEPAGSNRP